MKLEKPFDSKKVIQYLGASELCESSVWSSTIEAFGSNKMPCLSVLLIILNIHIFISNIHTYITFIDGLHPIPMYHIFIIWLLFAQHNKTYRHMTLNVIEFDAQCEHLNIRLFESN